MAGDALVKVGPFGSSSSVCIKWDEKGHGKITQIYISYGDDYISSLQFQYADQHAKLVLSPLYGEHNAPKFERLTFDVNEYITRLSGMHHRQYANYTDAIVSLTIETNKKKHGPFGRNEIVGVFERFCFAFGPSNQFGGFHVTFKKKSSPSIRLYNRLYIARYTTAVKDT